MAHILVVDDSPSTLELFRVLLQHEGYSVTTAATGAEALAAFETAAPNLVVLDLYLPEVAGWEVLAALKTRHRTPIILITAEENREALPPGVLAQADAFLVKPFELRQLIKQIRALLGLPLYDEQGRQRGG